MNIKYEIIETPFGKSILKTENDIISEIPMDESNSDYQAYLASLDEQQAALAEK